METENSKFQEPFFYVLWWCLRPLFYIALALSIIVIAGVLSQI